MKKYINIASLTLHQLVLQISPLNNISNMPYENITAGVRTTLLYILRCNQFWKPHTARKATVVAKLTVFYSYITMRSYSLLVIKVCDTYFCDSICIRLGVLLFLAGKCAKNIFVKRLHGDPSKNRDG